MRRRELNGYLAVGIVVLLGAIFAARPDWAWMLFAEVSPTPQAKPAAQAAPSPDTKSARIQPQAQPAGAAADEAIRARPEQGKPATAAKPSESAAPGTARTAALSPAPAPRQPAAGESSKFDVVRIDPEGASVFAGRAPANARVTVLANGQPVATATANDQGEWSSVIERWFPAGDLKLSLQTKSGGQGTEAAGQSVSVKIAASPPPPPADAKVATPARSLTAPAPITFIYDEDTFTENGRRIASALTEYVKQRNLQTITLTGHADNRGSDDYNMELSRRRLESVARFLREAGYQGKLVLLPMGKREPYADANRARMSSEDAYQLDRRVELRATP